MPSGKYLMEDFYYAGGLPVILNELRRPSSQKCNNGYWKNHHDNIGTQCECYNLMLLPLMKNLLFNMPVAW
jgi:dihydroxy-acid dehydratase